MIERPRVEAKISRSEPSLLSLDDGWMQAKKYAVEHLINLIQTRFRPVHWKFVNICL